MQYSEAQLMREFGTRLRRAPDPSTMHSVTMGPKQSQHPTHNIANRELEQRLAL